MFSPRENGTDTCPRIPRGMVKYLARDRIYGRGRGERTHAYCLTASMPTSLALAWDLVFTLGCVPGRVHSRLMAFLGSARLSSMACVLSVGSAASVVGVASVVGAVSKT